MQMRPPVLVWRKDGERELVHQQERVRLVGSEPLFAEDITVESDSGGHTDNRPLGALLPTIARLRDEMQARHGFSRPIRVGAAGGVGAARRGGGRRSHGAASGP